MLSTIRSLLKDESGATAIEYALLVAGIGILLAGTLTGVTDAIDAVMTKAKNAINPPA